ncbi:ribonuclease H1 small subunit [Hypoxylon trugodes]|uniref:ribonuclease H1 small subunit n=1 Tax=Hypoxylon trugodes TaxID=326681 RepID=UPI0021990D40|nr:ribonuclease H1 small subunit [Hypoxylon trugodes]KAI1383655.1 ribonuclease H1 small subunit [Hypoxylon trugodes]
MAHPVFTVESQETIQKKAQVNLLPCRIHHDGNISPIDTYWSPDEGEEQTKTAYIRGRKLHGKSVKLPEGYYGSVVEKSAPKKPEEPRREDLDEDVEIQEEPEDQLEVGGMQGKATFDEFTIWGHEALANASEDPYLRSMEEWISFAEQIHSYTPPEPSKPQN